MTKRATSTRWRNSPPGTAAPNSLKKRRARSPHQRKSTRSRGRVQRSRERDPDAAFGKLARHLLLAPKQEQLKTAIERSSFEKLRQQEAEHGFREKPEAAERFFREGRAGQWREKLSRRQVRRIVSDHKRMMKKFSYLTDELEHFK